RYSTPDGEITNGANPNGSTDNVAGILGDTENVAVLMPHPERVALADIGPTDGRGILAGFGATTVAP
ncbi:MAG: phosphoribosylformylglycinamidine synthase subunit PurQ, partial [Halodesulfurarchaeum sp.]|nr:phosphoribosylformylglycinamidine synthase subunit PurQ [Halodesulfurarchaeum sp.]